jgi:hypothetical protein
MKERRRELAFTRMTLGLSVAISVGGGCADDTDPDVEHLESSFAIVATELDEPLYLTDRTGTSFTVGGVTLSSTVEIHVRSMMVDRDRVDFLIEAVSRPAARLTVAGLTPNARIYVYDGSLKQPFAVTTSSGGEARWTQTLGSVVHGIWLQAQRGTYFIDADATSGNGGDCATIGQWNQSEKTCFLTTNVGQLQISSSATTLDCTDPVSGERHVVGRPVVGSPSLVVKANTSGVVVQSCRIEGSIGVQVSAGAADARIVNSELVMTPGSGFAVFLFGAGSGTEITQNTIVGTTAIQVRDSANAVIQGNTVGARFGINVLGSPRPGTSSARTPSRCRRDLRAVTAYS